MPTALHEFQKTKPFLLCVDSDGCAMDTMNIKHFRCFGPCFADEWGLDAGRDAALKRWNEINLFSMTRGINRFLGLAQILTELFPGDRNVAAFSRWAKGSKELSERAVEAHARGKLGVLCIVFAARLELVQVFDGRRLYVHDNLVVVFRFRIRKFAVLRNLALFV